MNPPPWNPILPPDLARKGQRVLELLSSYPSTLTAYSGGVDSTLVAVLAQRVGGRALAVTADSPSLPREELALARQTAQTLGLNHRVILGKEMADPAYQSNGLTRCYHCKGALYRQLKELAQREEWGVILNGTNLDDLGDYRPGLTAAQEQRVAQPLAEAGLTKADTRALAQALGLPNWQKPAQACLASRLPYGTAVTPQALAQVEQAEQTLRGLGFSQVRVRHHGTTARIELPPEDMARAWALGQDLARAIKAAGFTFAALDLEGYRSGSLNEGQATESLVPVNHTALPSKGPRGCDTPAAPNIPADPEPKR